MGWADFGSTSLKNNRNLKKGIKPTSMSKVEQLGRPLRLKRKQGSNEKWSFYSAARDSHNRLFSRKKLAFYLAIVVLCLFFYFILS